MEQLNKKANTNTMSDFTRNGKKWTVTECLKLEREIDVYNITELLLYSNKKKDDVTYRNAIDDIAISHKRTANAIMFKLDEEGLSDYYNLYNRYHS